MRGRAFLKFLSAIFLLAVVFSYAMFQGGFVSWFLFYSVTSVVVFTALVALFPLKVRAISRTVHQTLPRSGERIDVTIELQKYRFQPFFFVRLIDQVPETIGKGKATALFFFSFQPTLKFTYSIERAKRGVHTFHDVTAVLTDLFGWIERRIDIPCETTVYVFPNVFPLRELPVLKGMKEFEGQRLDSIDKTGRSIAGIREYIPGDRLTMIDWKHSARSNHLMTKEFETLQGEEIVLAFDPYLEDVERSFFEKIVDFTASVMAQFVHKHSQIELAVRFEGWVSVPVMSQTFTDGLKLLAQVQPNTSPIEKIDPIYLKWKEKLVYMICVQLDDRFVEACLTMVQQQTKVSVYFIERRVAQGDEIVAQLRKNGVDVYVISL